MFWFWRKPDRAPARAAAGPRLDQLSDHLRRDLNLPEDVAILSPSFIRLRNLPQNPSF